jgi:hypothetical protein
MSVINPQFTRSNRVSRSDYCRALHRPEAFASAVWNAFDAVRGITLLPSPEAGKGLPSWCPVTFEKICIRMSILTDFVRRIDRAEENEAGAGHELQSRSRPNSKQASTSAPWRIQCNSLSIQTCTRPKELQHGQSTATCSDSPSSNFPLTVRLGQDDCLQAYRSH